MENTNPKKLRAELKDYLELASQEPIRIQRRSGENYILMNENVYADMKSEIESLQRRLLSINEVVEGKGNEYTSKAARLQRLRK